MPPHAQSRVLASWEIPYDFNPKIHVVPGVKGVVHKAWRTRRNKRVPPPLPDGSETTRSASAAAKLPTRHTIRDGEKKTHTAKGPVVKPSSSSTNNRGAPPSSGAAAAAEHVVTAPTKPSASTPQSRPARRYRQARSSLWSAPKQKQTYTTSDINSLLEQSEARSHSAAGETRRPKASHHYGPRSVNRYSLPPSYAQWMRWWRSHDTPPVVYESSHRARTELQLANTVQLRRGGTRRELYELLAQTAPWTLSEAMRSKLIPTEGEGYDYNVNMPDVYADTAAERLAAQLQRESGMRERLIGGVVPLRDWEDGASSDRDGVMVADNGHLDSGIYVCPSGTADVRETIEEDAIAVVVKPITAELGRTLDEPSRGLPKGREWDRQHAIQQAVGTTAQEAIIDLQLDERYRRPGEYVRWRRGEDSIMRPVK